MIVKKYLFSRKRAVFFTSFTSNSIQLMVTFGHKSVWGKIWWWNHAKFLLVFFPQNSISLLGYILKPLVMHAYTFQTSVTPSFPGDLDYHRQPTSSTEGCVESQMCFLILWGWSKSISFTALSLLVIRAGTGLSNLNQPRAANCRLSLLMGHKSVANII